MKFRLWSDYHKPELRDEIAAAWRGDQVLITRSPTLTDNSIVEILEQQREWPEQPVFGVFTSGTLSSPRLVLYSRRNVEASLDAIHRLFELDQIEHVFCYPQAFHTFGLTLGYVASHLRGWQLHTPPGKYGRSSHRARCALKEERCLTLGTPTHFYDLIQHVQETGEDLRPSYSCIAGGASVSRKLWNEIRKELKVSAPSVGYGCTEAAPGISHLSPGVEPTSDSAIGTPLPSLTSTPGPDGVLISGSSLCFAILESGTLTFPEAVTIRDHIEVDEQGHWHFAGRLDLMLNRGGVKYSIEAIERDLTEVARRTIAVTAVRDERLGEDLAVAVVGPPDSGDIQKQIDSVLKSHWGLKLDARKLRFLPTLPLNASAKIDRDDLKRSFL